MSAHVYVVVSDLNASGELVADNAIHVVVSDLGIRGPAGADGAAGAAGSGLELSGTAADEAALPAAADHENEFYGTTDAPDAGKIWFSNGSSWTEVSMAGGLGTVTSVAVTGSDGIEVDSGSPITTAGTIALGINAATLRSTINVENGADVTDATNVTAAGALMDSEVAALSGIKTLVVPDNTTISTFAATILDDTTAAGVRTTIGAEVAGAAAAITLSGLGGVPTSRTITAGTGLSGGGDLSADRTLAVSYGTTAGTAAEGNDSRLSDARAPTAHNHAASEVTSGTIATARLGSGTADSSTYLRGDQTWAVVSGGSATQAFGTIAVSGQSSVVADTAPDTLTLVAGTGISLTTDAGADSITITATGGASHDAVTLAGTPDYLTLSGQQITLGQIDLSTDVTGSLPYASLSGAPTTWAASAITSGTLDIARIPTGTTSATVAVGNDARLSDARTPTAHASSHGAGGSDAITPSAIGAAPAPGYLAGLQIARTGTNSLSVGAGVVEIGGVLISVSAQTASSLTLDGPGQIWIYVDADDGRIYTSQTAPALRDSARPDIGWQYPSDATRRAIGWLQIYTDDLLPVQIASRRGRWYEVVAGEPDTGSFLNAIVSSGAASTNWASATTTPYVPDAACSVSIVPKIIGNTGADGTLGVWHADRGSGAIPNTGWHWRAQPQGSGARVFFGRATIDRPAGQSTLWWRLQGLAGTPTANVEIYGGGCHL